MAFPVGYNIWQDVTIDYTKVDATLTDYPCLVDLSDLSKAGADIFDICRSDGGDIRVTLSDGTTQLAREVVSIDTGAKTGELHVKTPSLSSSVDTVIRIWYNGVDTEPAEDSTYGKENTWNINYVMVQHNNQDPSGSAPQMIDSTANDHDGTSAGTMTSGDLVPAQIGDGLQFDGLDDLIGHGAISSELSSDVTFSAWLKKDVLEGGVKQAMTSEVASYFNYWMALGVFGAKWNFVMYDGSQNPIAASDLNYDTSAIHLLHGVRDTVDDKLYLYLDGVLQGSGVTDTTTSTPTYSNFVTGAQAGSAGRKWGGIVDEPRVLSAAISADWISTEYNNQSSPGTFYSVSDEHGGVVSVMLEALWSDGQSKAKTLDQIVPFEADWSDGQSIVYVISNVEVVFVGTLSVGLENQAISLSGKKVNSGGMSVEAGSVELTNAGKEGLNGKLQITLEDLELLMSGLMLSRNIDQIIITTKTGEIVFDSAKTGRIEFGEPATENIIISTSS